MFSSYRFDLIPADPFSGDHRAGFGAADLPRDALAVCALGQLFVLLLVDLTLLAGNHSADFVAVGVVRANLFLDRFTGRNVVLNLVVGVLGLANCSRGRALAAEYVATSNFIFTCHVFRAANLLPLRVAIPLQVVIANFDCVLVGNLLILVEAGLLERVSAFFVLLV